VTHSLVFFNRTYKEAQGLIQTSREYMTWRAPIDIQAMNSKESHKLTHEAMRIAIRLNQITVWMMVQKALQKGEISHEESLSEEYKVLQGPVYLEKKSESDSSLPSHLRKLLYESRCLYERVLRLDHMSRKNHLSSQEA